MTERERNSGCNNKKNALPLNLFLTLSLSFSRINNFLFHYSFVYCGIVVSTLDYRTKGFWDRILVNGVFFEFVHHVKAFVCSLCIHGFVLRMFSV